MPRRDSRCLVRSDWSLRARGSFDWDDIVASVGLTLNVFVT